MSRIGNWITVIEKKLPKLGSGKRFANLKGKIAARGNVDDPGAVAAAIGRAKYGAKRFGRLGAMGKSATGYDELVEKLNQ
jgi:hypothetical protein